MKSGVEKRQLSIINFLLAYETFPHRASWFRGVFEDYTLLEVSAAAKLDLRVLFKAVEREKREK